MSNRGPLGGETNAPKIDEGTLARRQSVAPGPRCDGQQAVMADWLAAKAMLGGARAVMDEYAKEIFDLWFGGKAGDEVVFDDARWGAYMRANQGLSEQVDRQLSLHADQLREDVDAGPGRLQGQLALTFHAEVGSAHGELRTGYDVLHGTNRSAGDFGITGRFTAVRTGPAGSAYDVAYEGLVFVFNDIVDINKKFAADVMFGRLAGNMARCLGTGPPKDYTLRIRWRAESPVTIHVAGRAEGQAPRWLKAFPNR